MKLPPLPSSKVVEALVHSNFVASLVTTAVGAAVTSTLTIGWFASAPFIPDDLEAVPQSLAAAAAQTTGFVSIWAGAASVIAWAYHAATDPDIEEKVERIRDRIQQASEREGVLQALTNMRTELRADIEALDQPLPGTSCWSCKYRHTSPYLQCAVRPHGHPEFDDCPDWELIGR